MERIIEIDLIDKYDKLPKESLPNDNVVYSFVNLDTNLPNWSIPKLALKSEIPGIYSETSK